jgi:hypothetical protein
MVEPSQPPKPITSDGPLPYDVAHKLIHQELHSDGAEVRAEYVKHFGEEIRAFTELMAKAVTTWRHLDYGVSEREVAFVAGLANAAITLHIESMKLFLDGHFIAAGNLFRQVVETIALTLLCSNRDLGFLMRFMANQYSTNKAIRDLLQPGNWRKLRLDGNALTQFQKSQQGLITRGMKRTGERSARKTARYVSSTTDLVTRLS